MSTALPDASSGLPTTHFILHSQKLQVQAYELFEALEYDTSDSADFFKEKASDVSQSTLVSLRDRRPGNEGRTLLHNAARKGSLSAVLFLIRAGHPIEPIDSCVSKRTPLHEAIAYKHLEVAVVLIEAGASLLTADVNRENAIHYAARSGSAKILRALLTSAGISGDRERVKELMQTQTIKRRLPEDIAGNEMIRTILKGLREHGQMSPIFRPGAAAM